MSGMWMSASELKILSDLTIDIKQEDVQDRPKGSFKTDPYQLKPTDMSKILPSTNVILVNRKDV